jgi:hypothetical protein
VVQVGSQKYRRVLKEKLLSYLACNQNWLNISMDDCHFNYTRKWTQKKVEKIPFLSVNSKKNAKKFEKSAKISKKPQI